MILVVVLKGTIATDGLQVLNGIQPGLNNIHVLLVAFLINRITFWNTVNSTIKNFMTAEKSCFLNVFFSKIYQLCIVQLPEVFIIITPELQCKNRCICFADLWYPVAKVGNAAGTQLSGMYI